MTNPIATTTLQDARNGGFKSYCFSKDYRKAIRASVVAKMVDDARAAMKRSYSPYSKFRVGASVFAKNNDGTTEIFTGTNIENAAYGPTNCAERVAIQTAVAAGYSEIIAVTVVGDSPPGHITGPCGTCRQVIFEHGGGSCLVFMVDSNDHITVVDADILLPYAFGPENLS